MKIEEQNLHRYDDIINLPHPVSRSHPRMTVQNRAAQFAPFAALTGYGDAVNETARLTDQKMELDENNKQILDEKLQMIQKYIAEKKEQEEFPEVTITYFKADEKKEGGAYLTATGRFLKIDIYEHAVVLQDKSRYPVRDIVDLQCDLFRYLDNFTY